jgi:oligoendopeptidase F
MSTNEEKYQGPAISLDEVYTSLDSPQIQQDLSHCEKRLQELSLKALELEKLLESEDSTEKTQLAQVLTTELEAIGIEIYTIKTFAHIHWSIDSSDSRAMKLFSSCNNLYSELSQLDNIVDMYVKLATDKEIKDYLSHPDVKPHQHRVERIRDLKDFTLSLKEEKLISSLNPTGHQSWAELHDHLTGQMKKTVNINGKSETLGLSQLTQLVFGGDAKKREAAWLAREETIAPHVDTCASALNALSGWQLNLYKRRSSVKPLHFLDMPVHENATTLKTIEAMFHSAASFRKQYYPFLKKQAEYLKEEKLSAWNLMAPCPTALEEEEKLYTFAEGMELIKNAFSTIHPEMADFAQMMVDKNYIEGRILPNKRIGAFCARIARDRSSRIMSTYSGRMRNVLTTAHELGHAFHGYLTKDLPHVQTLYPMTLAETASTVAESVLLQHLVDTADSSSKLFETAWDVFTEGQMYLLGIPARYNFEKKVYEKRMSHTLTAEEIQEIFDECFQNEYQDSVVGHSSKIWAITPHYYIPNFSFYNFPYTFGFLFAHGILAKKDNMGEDFYPAYREILRDTGRMTANDLIQKHLDQDIEEEIFWQDSIERVLKLASPLLENC